ncbi:MAG: peptidoglycan editing factor PgeF [Candidatus Paraimprobicoccus trichonymphae]|uniref:Purine nucleoside phosphorylase n=1 Tax=Candidatus Paraimprobicoccus trichonymphae TaxID=3033793 RepID=A0AA48I978_9FIRM|nr:MAG: peptidoglycan editing factor PgeF [Candidatus Paraimprobicoccus trichonymphae]
MNINFSNAVCYLTFKELEKFDFLKHSFSTRLGGVSKNEFKSMNFSFSNSDLKENVIENYKIFCEATKIDYNRLILPNQNHTNNIKIVTEKNLKPEFWNDKENQDIDGFVTNEKNINLVTFHADCLPVYFLDPTKKIIGLVHSGWRGTVKKISKNMINILTNKFDSKVQDIICCIGPGIKKCCYEMDISMITKFEKINLDINKFIEFSDFKNKIYLDLDTLSKLILINCGILEKNIFISDLCTKCNSGLLFSHRATKGKKGNMVASMTLI